MPTAPPTDPHHGPPLARLLLQTADALAAVRAGRSLTEVLAACPPALRGGTQALAFHVLRQLGTAEALRALLAPKAPQPAVDALLVTALALLVPPAADDADAGVDAGRALYPPHTLVSQAVAAVRQRKPAAAGFVNAVLRRCVREQAELLATVRRQPVALWNHPAWWIAQVQQDWPLHADAPDAPAWPALLDAANRHPPMVLRVNARRTDAAAYVQRLAAAGHAAAVVGPQAVALARPCPVQALPGFADGDVSVQDLSAQRAAPLLLGDGAQRLPPGARVLDACAAPGGKTAHLLEAADLDLLALDSDATRLARVRDTLDRLGLAAPAGQRRVELKAADARDTAAWWDGRPFDAILLDAPCSASGIVRRHPDVRWLRRPTDIPALAATQAALLDALWPLLAPGGRLVYATCSVFRAEGGRQIDAFLQRTVAGRPRLDPSSPGHLPGVPDNPGSPTVTGDGFFYALIHAT